MWVALQIFFADKPERYAGMIGTGDASVFGTAVLEEEQKFLSIVW